jgi:hypothetical protein
LGTTFRFAKDIEEVADRLVSRVSSCVLKEILQEHGPDLFVQCHGQTPQQLGGAAMASDILLVRQGSIHELVDLRVATWPFLSFVLTLVWRRDWADKM